LKQLFQYTLYIIYDFLSTHKFNFPQNLGQMALKVPGSQVPKATQQLPFVETVELIIFGKNTVEICLKTPK